MLQTPRNPFIKDGKFFYTLFQNCSSIKKMNQETYQMQTPIFLYKSASDMWNVN